MLSIILAAGYATRLYPLTENFPKPLLKIGDNPILDKLMADIDQIEDITEHIIVTNHKFIAIFEEWKASSHYTKPVTLIDDGSTHNDNRLGAVNDLLFALNRLQIKNEDLLVLAADNLLDFSIAGFVVAFKEKQTSMIMCHYEKELKALQKTGVITIDAHNKVLTMEEKPAEPKSNWAVPPFYIYKASDIPLIKLCVAENKNSADAPGNLVRLLTGKTPFHAWEMPGKRMDIGSLEDINSPMINR